MAIKISGTDVINNSRNITAVGLYSPAAGTKSWTSGKKTINIQSSDNNIIIDGLLTAGNIIVPLA